VGGIWRGVKIWQPKRRPYAHKFPLPFGNPPPKPLFAHNVSSGNEVKAVVAVFGGVASAGCWVGCWLLLLAGGSNISSVCLLSAKSLFRTFYRSQNTPYPLYKHLTEYHSYYQLLLLFALFGSSVFFFFTFLLCDLLFIHFIVLISIIRIIINITRLVNLMFLLCIFTWLKDIRAFAYLLQKYC